MENLFSQYQTMGLLKIRIVVVQSLIDFKVASKVEFLPNLVDDVHVEVYSLNLGFLGKILLQLLHHLPANSVFPVGLEHNKSEDIGVELLLVIFQPDGVAPNDDIVVVGQLGELGVLGGNFKIKARGVFNRKRVVIKFSKNVYIFIVYFSHRYRQGFSFALGHCFYLYQLQQLVINSIQG